MTLSADDLQAAWDALPPESGPRQFRSRRLDGTGKLSVHVARRSIDGAPALLLDLNAPDSAQEEFEVGGMRLHRTTGETGLLLVLCLEDPARAGLFATICADAIDAAVSDIVDSLASFLGRLDAWRAFLREIRSGLPRSEIVGLFGELLVLERLVDADPASLLAWKAPDRGLHDFEREGQALEIKATLGPSSVIHVSTLDQLDARGLSVLVLVRVRLAEDVDGRTLEGVVEAIANRLVAAGLRGEFRNRLLRRGLDVLTEPQAFTLRVREQAVEAWKVGDGFPRLLRDHMPLAIREATYQLDPRALTTWGIDPEDAFALMCESSQYG